MAANENIVTEMVFLNNGMIVICSIVEENHIEPLNGL
jgi:hypothetical protein